MSIATSWTIDATPNLCTIFSFARQARRSISTTPTKAAATARAVPQRPAARGESGDSKECDPATSPRSPTLSWRTDPRVNTRRSGGVQVRHGPLLPQRLPMLSGDRGSPSSCPSVPISCVPGVRNRVGWRYTGSREVSNRRRWCNAVPGIPIQDALLPLSWILLFASPNHHVQQGATRPSRRRESAGPRGRPLAK